MESGEVKGFRAYVIRAYVLTGWGGVLRLPFDFAQGATQQARWKVKDFRADANVMFLRGLRVCNGNNPPMALSCRGFVVFRKITHCGNCGNCGKRTFFVLTLFVLSC